MNNVINDERTIAVKRKIQSDALQILVYALWVTVLVQQVFLKAPISQFIVEFICALGASIYVLIRTICIGIDNAGTGKATPKYLLTITLLSGAMCVICLAFLCGIKDMGFLCLFFVGYILVLFCMRYAIKYFTEKKQKQIDEKLFRED